MAAVPSIGRAARVEGGRAPEADLTRALYEQYANQIFRYCLHQLGSREEAEDAVQSTFLNAFRGIKRGVVPELESAWLFKIAHNVCLSRRRTSWRRGRIESPTDFDVVEELTPAPSRRSDELIGLQDVLEQLPENQRRAILLREWQGLSYREISEELDLSQAAVETLIFRARRALASGLEQPSASKRRIARGADLGNILAGLKSLLLGGGAAVKVAATVAVVSATTVVAAAPVQQHRAQLHRSPKPAAPAPSSSAPAAPSSNAAYVAGPEAAFPAKGAARHRQRSRLQNSAAFAAGQVTSTALTSAVTSEAPAQQVPEAPVASEPASTPAPPTPPAPEPAPAPAAVTPAPATAPVTTPAADKTTPVTTDKKSGTAQTGQGGSSTGTGSTQQTGAGDTRTSSSSTGATTTPVVTTAPTGTTPVVQTKTTTGGTTTTSSSTPSGSSQGNTPRVITPVVNASPVIVSAPVAPAPAPAPAPAAKVTPAPAPAPVVAAPVTATQPAPVVSSPTLSLSSGSTSIGKGTWKGGGNN